MGPDTARLSPFASRHAGARIFWIQFRNTTVTNGGRRVQQQYPSAANASTVTATDHAAMAVNAEQSIAWNVPNCIPTTSPTYSTNVNRTDANSCICIVNEIDINPAKDFD